MLQQLSICVEAVVGFAMRNGLFRFCSNTIIVAFVAAVIVWGAKNARG